MSSEQKTYSTDIQGRNDYRNKKLEEIKSFRWSLSDYLPRFVIQLIPERECEIDLQNQENQIAISETLKPFFDNFYPYKPTEKTDESYALQNSYAYTKIYKDGRVEIVRASYVISNPTTKFIPIKYEQEVNEAIKQSLDVMKQLGVDTPIFVTISLLDVEGYKLKKNNSDEYSQEEIPAENKDISLGEFIVSNYDTANKNIESSTKPTYELVRENNQILETNPNNQE